MSEKALSIVKTVLRDGVIDPNTIFADCWKEVHANLESNGLPKFIEQMSKHNIDNEQAYIRLYLSILFFILTAALLVPLMALKYNNFIRLGAFPLFASSVIGFIQY